MLRVAIVFFFLINIACADSDTRVITFLQEPGGEVLVFEADKQLVKKLPVWDPELADPPLGIRQALSIAKKKIEHDFPSKENKLVDIHLRYNFQLNEPTVWFYAILYTVGSSNSGSSIANKTIYVLMNGDVLDYRVISKSEFGSMFK